jgi:hyperosmotically inducible protein
MKILKQLSLINLILSLILGFSTAASAETKSNLKNVVSDTAITASVKSKYALDKDIKAMDVHVTTTNGIVHLKGKVPSIDIGDRAVDIALKTDGVKEVVYNLDDVWHAPKERSTAGNVIADTAITAAVKGKYAMDDMVSALDLSVETTNGKVHLKGKVPTLAAAERAVNIAQDTDGVKEVLYKLELKR